MIGDRTGLLLAWISAIGALLFIAIVTATGGLHLG